MGFLGKVEEFFADQGSYAGSFIKDALGKVTNYACLLHYNTPGVIFDVSPFNRALWRSLCANRPAGLPSVAPPFQGGQCKSVVYDVNIHYEIQKLADGQIIYRGDGGRQVEGPVKGVAIYSDSNNSSVGVVAAGPANGLPYQGGYFHGVDSASIYDFKYVNYRINFVRRLDGQPDNCGDLPVPGSTPVVLPPAQRTTNIVVNNVNGETTNVTAILDFPSASVDFGVNVPLKVEIDGRKFYLNVEGWYSGEPDGGGAPDLQPINENILKLEGTLNQYFAPVNPSDDDTLVLISPSGDKPSDQQESVPNARWLVVDLTKMPDKAQYGGDSPTVYFAGWIEFLKEGRAFPRQQINFEQSIFRFPDGADGYAYTFTNGAQGNVSVYVEENQ